MGEVDKISRKFILCDNVRNSHDHSVLQSIDIRRRNLMMVTLRVIGGLKITVDLPFAHENTARACSTCLA